MWTSLTLVLVLVGVAGACAGGDDDEATSPTPSRSGSAAAGESAGDTASPPEEAGSQVASAASEAAATVPAGESVPASMADTTVDTRCGELAAGTHEFTVAAGGADHPVRVFVPSERRDGLLPTVLNWHGLGSNGPDQARFTGYEDLAEAEGFLVVHPTGVPGPGAPTNSWELTEQQDPGRDDLAFAGVLIDTLIAEWCADPNRVYSTGMSNGGYFTARLVCELGDRIAAASSIAGTFHPESCTPARPVPYLAYHGTADLVVPFDGSGQSVLVTGDDPVARAFFEQVMPAEFAEFAADAGCTPPAAGAPVDDDVIRYDYRGCSDDIVLTFYEITGGGHTWPNSPLADLVAGSLGYTTDSVDATADSWAYFEQHTLN